MAVLVASLLVTSACSFGELLEFVEGSPGGGDLRAPENPIDVQAAGSTVEAKSDDDQAKDKIAEALDPELAIGNKIGLATDAIALRPADPRYLMQRAWFNRIAGDDDAAKVDMAAAFGLAREAYSAEESDRRYAEFYMDATYTIMNSYPADSNIRARMEQVYCVTLFLYRADYASTLLGTAYIDFNAHLELCGP